MKVTPKTEDQLGQEELIPEGLYKFEVLSAEDKTSKSGNEMIKIVLALYDSSGIVGNLNDYLLNAMDRKLRHFCFVTDNLNNYKSEKLLPEHCIGKTGIVNLVIQKGKEKKDGTLFPDQNSVEDYFKDGEDEEDKKDVFINNEINIF